MAETADCRIDREHVLTSVRELKMDERVILRCASVRKERVGVFLGLSGDGKIAGFLLQRHGEIGLICGFFVEPDGSMLDDKQRRIEVETVMPEVHHG